MLKASFKEDVSFFYESEFFVKAADIGLGMKGEVVKIFLSAIGE